MEAGMRLEGKVAIITGAARGIGEATAVLFAREGAKVVIADKRQEEGEKVARRIRDEGGEATFVVVDTTDEQQVKDMVVAAVKAYGTVNVLVNNAGVFVLSDVHELTNEQYDHVMNTDVRGYLWCSKYVVPHMLRAGGGSIIMNSSASALVADPDLAIYCAAKAAVNGMVRGMALDYGSRNIRVNAVCPGTIDTPFNVDYFNAMPDPEAARREIGATHVLGRMGTAMEMAYCFLFLACDESSFVTGSSLVADGGMSIFVNATPRFLAKT
jgi:NAD(P)-dependent dehydrogenase (short-subunit alcohol dehydrogenase family)